MAWMDFETNLVAVPPGGGVLRTHAAADVKVFDGITGAPVQLRQGGVDVTTLTADTSGWVTFQALDSLVVRVEALGQSQLVESVQQKQAKAGFAGDLDTAVDAGLDRAEADGRMLSPDVAAATYANLTTLAGKVGKGDLVRNVRDHGAKGDGTTDDTAAVQAALTAAAGSALYFPPGTYRLTNNLTVPRDTVIVGAGSEVVTLDWSTKATWTFDPLVGFLTWETGQVVTTVPLAADVVSGDGSVTVTNGAAFAVGDYIRITSDEVLFDEAAKAEFHRVVQKDGNILYLSVGAFDSYAIASAGVVEKVDLATGGIRGVTIRGKGLNPASVTDDGIDANRGDNALMFQFCRDVHITDVRFVKVENRCIRLNSVLGVLVQGCTFRFDPARVRLQYGVSLNGATQLASVVGCVSWSDRHLVTTSTSGSLAAEYRMARGIPRVITITGCTAHGSWQDPIDTHRGGEYVTITGNALTTEAVGVKVRGVRVVITGNIITGKRASPYATVLAGVRVALRNQSVRIANNIIRNFADGVRVDQPEGTVRDIAIDGNTIVGCVNSVSINDTAAEVRISGNYLTPSSDGYAVYINATVTGLQIVDNTIIGGVQGMYATVTSTQTITSCLIARNYVRLTSSHGIFARNVTDTLVTGNLFSGVVGDSIRLSGNNTNLSVTGNMTPTAGKVVDLSATRTNVFAGMNGPMTKPTVPTSPTTTQLRDALVALGLVQ